MRIHTISTKETGDIAHDNVIKKQQHNAKENKQSIPENTSLAYQTEGAEEKSKTLAQQLQQVQTELLETKKSLSDSKEQRSIDIAISNTSPIDIETVQMLTKNRLNDMKVRDVKRAVHDIQRSKPFLFGTARQNSATMSTAHEEHAAPVIDAAREAMRRGDRSSLLRYLRLRRGD